MARINYNSVYNEIGAATDGITDIINSALQGGPNYAEYLGNYLEGGADKWANDMDDYIEKYALGKTQYNELNTMGILNAVNFTIPDEASWDIGRDLEGKEDPNSFQLPQMINVSQFQFTPISNFLERSVSPKYAKGEFARPDENYISMGTNASGYDSTFEARKNSNQVKSSIINMLNMFQQAESQQIKPLRNFLQVYYEIGLRCCLRRDYAFISAILLIEMRLSF